MFVKINTEATEVVATKKDRTMAVGGPYVLGSLTVHRDGGAVVIGIMVARETEKALGHSSARLYRPGLLELKAEIDRMLAEGVNEG